MNDNETIAGILAEMRAEQRPYGISIERLRSYADRIEAAAKRDAAIHAMTCEANERLREHLEIALEGKPGNAAAMREALENLVYRKCLVQGSCGKPMGELCTHTGCIWHQYRAALSAPARNCDVLSEEAANEAWDEYMHSHVLPRGGWNFRHIIRWLYAKAEGGDHA